MLTPYQPRRLHAYSKLHTNLTEKHERRGSRWQVLYTSKDYMSCKEGGQSLRGVNKHAGKPNFPRHCKYLCCLWLLKSKQNGSQESLCQDNPGNISLSSLPRVYPGEPSPKIPDKARRQGAEWNSTLLLPVTHPPSTPANLQHHPLALYLQPPKEASPKFHVSGAQWGHCTIQRYFSGQHPKWTSKWK